MSRCFPFCSYKVSLASNRMPVFSYSSSDSAIALPISCVSAIFQHNYVRFSSWLWSILTSDKVCRRFIASDAHEPGKNGRREIADKNSKSVALKTPGSGGSFRASALRPNPKNQYTDPHRCLPLQRRKRCNHRYPLTRNYRPGYGPFQGPQSSIPEHRQCGI